MATTKTELDIQKQIDLLVSRAQEAQKNSCLTLKSKLTPW
jgi:hypothetical protein